MGRAGMDYYTQKLVETWPVGAKGSANFKGRIYNEIRTVKDITPTYINGPQRTFQSFLPQRLTRWSILYQERNTQTWMAGFSKLKGIRHRQLHMIYVPANICPEEMQSVYFMGSWHITTTCSWYNRPQWLVRSALGAWIIIHSSILREYKLCIYRCLQGYSHQ